MSQAITRQEKQAAVTLFEDAAQKQQVILKALRIPPEVFSRVLVNAMMKNPAIARCTKDSLYDATYTACQIGLMPDGRQGAIVPIKRGAQVCAEFWPMIDGLLMKVRKEIKGISLQAHTVHKGDVWNDERGSAPRLVHQINPEVPRTEETLICAYATAHFPDNQIPEVIVMYRDELAKFKKNNKGPWSQHSLEMYRIRPLKRLIKRLPVTGNLLFAFEDEEDNATAVSTGAPFDASQAEDAQYTDAAPVDAQPAPAAPPEPPAEGEAMFDSPLDTGAPAHTDGDGFL